jgi:hypothetical protein
MLQMKVAHFIWYSAGIRIWSPHYAFTSRIKASMKGQHGSVCFELDVSLIRIPNPNRRLIGRYTGCGLKLVSRKLRRLLEVSRAEVRIQSRSNGHSARTRGMTGHLLSLLLPPLIPFFFFFHILSLLILCFFLPSLTASTKQKVL